MAQWKQPPFRCITPLLREKMIKVPGFAGLSPSFASPFARRKGWGLARHTEENSLLFQVTSGTKCLSGPSLHRYRILRRDTIISMPCEST